MSAKLDNKTVCRKWCLASEASVFVALAEAESGPELLSVMQPWSQRVPHRVSEALQCFLF